MFPLSLSKLKEKICLNDLSLILNKSVLLKRFSLDLAREQCICLENYVLLLLEGSLDDQIKLTNGDGYHCGLHGSH